jgi:hypothetical protein
LMRSGAFFFGRCVLRRGAFWTATEGAMALEVGTLWAATSARSADKSQIVSLGVTFQQVSHYGRGWGARHKCGTQVPTEPRA